MINYLDNVMSIVSENIILRFMFVINIGMIIFYIFLKSVKGSDK